MSNSKTESKVELSPEEFENVAGGKKKKGPPPFSYPKQKKGENKLQYILRCRQAENAYKKKYKVKEIKNWKA